MNYKELDKRTQDLVKFADFLKRLVVLAKSNYLALMQAFPDKTIRKSALFSLMMQGVTF